MPDDELFGAPGQIELMKRSRWLWSVLGDDPRFAYYGRVVALSDHGADVADVLEALTRLQGASVCYFYPATLADDLFATLRERGLTMDRHEHFRGGDTALAASRKVLAEHSLPGDLAVSALGDDSPPEFVAQVAELCLACDVMPVPGSVWRGRAMKGLCLVATDRVGQPVATASSFMLHHPASKRAADVFWGMLATRQDRRGEKIALVLGAQAIIHMWEQHGARGFMTGVRADNVSSRALCNRLGVFATDWIYASCIDEAVLGGGSITK